MKLKESRSVLGHAEHVDVLRPLLSEANREKDLERGPRGQWSAATASRAPNPGGSETSGTPESI